MHGRLPAGSIPISRRGSSRGFRRLGRGHSSTRSGQGAGGGHDLHVSQTVTHVGICLLYYLGILAFFLRGGNDHEDQEAPCAGLSILKDVLGAGDLNVIIGPNGSGKSNLLKSFGYYRASEAGGINKRFEDSGGV